MQNTLHPEVSTILISNLHCNSCAQTIEQALATLSPQPHDVKISIDSQSVTLRHDGIARSTVASALETHGFDVVHALPSSSTEAIPLPNTPISTTQLTSRQRAHLEQCKFCQDSRQASTEKVLLPSPTQPKECRLVISVDGMTCAACVSSVTRAVSEIKGVRDVSVDLMGKAATVVAEEGLADSVVEAIGDCGFEANLLETESLDAVPAESTTRTVHLRIDGMFCQNCPQNAMDALEALGVTINKRAESVTDPIITVTYTPDAPNLTIRTLLQCFPPPLTATIHRPPSISDLARAMNQKEKRRLLYRLICSTIIAIPTLIIGIAYMMLVKDGNPTKAYLMEPMWAGNVSRAQWALLFLATPVMFYSASIFHRRSLKEIHALWRRGSNASFAKRFFQFGSMNMLVSSGVSVAYFTSIALLILASQHEPDMNGMGDETTYFDTVVFLTMFLLAGRYLESYSKSRTADAVAALGQLRASKAILVTSASLKGDPEKSMEGGYSPEIEDPECGASDESMATRVGMIVREVPVEHIDIGDIVRVPQGSSPPADGILLPGYSSSFDESSLTGESRPVLKESLDKVFAGTINQGRMVEIKVDRIGSGTMLDSIIKVVREGQLHRAPIERIADLITRYFVPIVTLIAISTWVIWMGLGLGGALPKDYYDSKLGGWPVWSLQFAIATFVVACPCGIGLAAPTALLVGSGLAAKFGILARGGGEAFQEMAQLDLLVFDKTGTLTVGSDPQVTDMKYTPSTNLSLDEKHILDIACALENTSSHPLALAIRDFCRSRGVNGTQGQNFEEIPGKGLKALFDTPEGHVLAVIGNEAWIRDHNVEPDGEMHNLLANWKASGKSVALLAVSPDQEETSFQIVAAFAVIDPPRPEARAVVQKLQDLGISTWMISGDNKITATAIAASVGIPTSNIMAEVLPHEKAEAVRRLQLEGAKKRPSLFKSRLNQRCIVGMVGDGVNDAPALTVADIGIAIGSGSDVAISSASFILLSSNLQSLLTLSDLSRSVFHRVLFNFGWACVYNVAAIPIAAGVIYPSHRVRLDPAWAALAMALSSVSVVCSSLLLKLYRPPKV